MRRRSSASSRNVPTSSGWPRLMGGSSAIGRSCAGPHRHSLTPLATSDLACGRLICRWPSPSTIDSSPTGSLPKCWDGSGRSSSRRSWRRSTRTFAWRSQAPRLANESSAMRHRRRRSLRSYWIRSGSASESGAPAGSWRPAAIWVHSSSPISRPASSGMRWKSGAGSSRRTTWLRCVRLPRLRDRA